MGRKVASVAASLMALVIAACAPGTATPLYLQPGNDVVVAQVTPGLQTIHLSVFGSPQVAPDGTLRKLHVDVYTQPLPGAQFGPPIGISSVALTFDNGSIGSVSLDPTQPYDTADLDWMPPTNAAPAGGAIEYTVQAAAQGVDPAQTRICVTYPGVSIDYLQQFNGETCLPPTAPKGSTAPTILGASAGLDHVNCSDVGAWFQIHASDPDNSVAYAYIQLENAELQGGGKSDGKLPFKNGAFVHDYFFYEEWFISNLVSQFPGGDVTIKWTAKLVAVHQGASGPNVQTISKGPYELHITLPICVNQPELLQVVHKPAIPPPSELGCPSGTYFAPVTVQCIPIQIQPGGEERSSDQQCPAGQTYTCSGLGITIVCGCK